MHFIYFEQYGSSDQLLKIWFSKIHAIHYEEKKGGRIICVCITLYKKVVGLFFEFTLHSLSMLTIIQIWGYLDTLTIIMERGSKRFIAKAFKIISWHSFTFSVFMFALPAQAMRQYTCRLISFKNKRNQIDFFFVKTKQK